MSDLFELKIIRQHWIKDDGLDDKHDLCSHGRMLVKIGNEILSKENDSFLCLSAAAILLMRTLKTNYSIGNFESQLIPCCGNFMYPDETGNSIIIGGCNIGLDWNINHKGKSVELSTVNTTIMMDTKIYQSIVLDFVNDVEEFYGNPNEKILPDDDDFTQECFTLFWKNWNELKEIINL